MSSYMAYMDPMGKGIFSYFSYAVLFLFSLLSTALNQKGRWGSIYTYIHELPIGTGDFTKSIWAFAGVADSGSGVAHRWWSLVAAMGVWRDISSSEDEQEEKLSIPMRIVQLFLISFPHDPMMDPTPCAGLQDDSGAGELHLLWRPLSAIGRTFG